MAKAQTKATPQPGIVEVQLSPEDLEDLNEGSAIDVRNGRYTIVVTPPSDINIPTLASAADPRSLP